MRIVVTDTGFIWNPNNPYLEKYKDDVLCVNLNGINISDKYQTFALDVKDVHRGRGMADTQKLRNCHMYDELRKRSDELAKQFYIYEDVFFLTDCTPSTLYPYHALKNKLKNNNLHLITMSPWKFMGNRQWRNHRALLEDLDNLKTLLYIDADKELTPEGEIKFEALIKTAEEYMGEQLRIVMSDIENIGDGRYFYDFNIARYISVDEGYGEVIGSLHPDPKFAYGHAVDNEVHMLGVPASPYSSIVDKEDVESLTPRIDGKEVCELLREKRIELAKLNGIDLDSEECPSDGPCAGTCYKCDAEAEYLRDELAKIPKQDRKYPSLDIER